MSARLQHSPVQVVRSQEGIPVRMLGSSKAVRAPVPVTRQIRPLTMPLLQCPRVPVWTLQKRPELSLHNYFHRQGVA